MRAWLIALVAILSLIGGCLEWPEDLIEPDSGGAVDAATEQKQDQDTPKLSRGEPCLKDAECASYHCECKEGSVGCQQRICCAEACKGTDVCKLDGSKCEGP